MSYRSLAAALAFIAISFGVRTAYAQAPAPASTVSVSTTVTVFGRKSAEPPPITIHDVTVNSGKTRLKVTGWVPAQAENPGPQIAIVIDNSANPLEVGG